MENDVPILFSCSDNGDYELMRARLCYEFFMITTLFNVTFERVNQKQITFQGFNSLGPVRRYSHFVNEQFLTYFCDMILTISCEITFK